MDGALFLAPLVGLDLKSQQQVSGYRLATLEISCACRNMLVYFGRGGAHEPLFASTGSNDTTVRKHCRNPRS